jgi:transcriptional regulator with XRE-family HTH domain
MNGEMSSTEFKSVSEAFSKIVDNETQQLFEKQLRSRQVVKTLVALRASKNLTQGDISEALGCSQAKISRIENGFDSDLGIAELEGYAKTTGCEVTLMFSERGKGLADQIKYHAFCIREAFLKLAELSHKDESIAQGVAELHVQAFININRFLKETAEKLPCHEETGESYIHIAECGAVEGLKSRKKRRSKLGQDSEREVEENVENHHSEKCLVGD